MIYKAIGTMSGSSLDGLDIVYAEFVETGGRWTFEILEAECIPYTEEWQTKLKNATLLSALDYQLLHTEFGRFSGEKINEFIERNHLQHKVHLIASHGHTSFHLPARNMTAQLGDGATIAAVTGLNVVTDLRALDVAYGGQGAPIVPIGEKLLFSGYDCFLNIGGIANITLHYSPSAASAPFHQQPEWVAFDVCAANRVLNMLAADAGREFDDGGKMAAGGNLNTSLLAELNKLEYYGQPYPKSLPNSFGRETVYPLTKKTGLPTADLLNTYTEHIAIQVKKALEAETAFNRQRKLLVTGGGALNHYLMQRLIALLGEANIEVEIPDEKIIQYKEALIMALIGVLRWREEANTISSVTGAAKESIGGALWLG